MTLNFYRIKNQNLTKFILNFLLGLFRSWMGLALAGWADILSAPSTEHIWFKSLHFIICASVVTLENQRSDDAKSKSVSIACALCYYTVSDSHSKPVFFFFTFNLSKTRLFCFFLQILKPSFQFQFFSYSYYIPKLCIS